MCVCAHMRGTLDGTVFVSGVFCFSNIYLPHTYFSCVYIFKKIHLTLLNTDNRPMITGNLIHTTSHIPKEKRFWGQSNTNSVSPTPVQKLTFSGAFLVWGFFGFFFFWSPGSLRGFPASNPAPHMSPEHTSGGDPLTILSCLTSERYSD